MPYLLVVEDDADSRDALCRFLKSAGYDCDCVADGREAVAAIFARAPDLIILDLFMPQMDGTGVLKLVRSYLRLQSIPVIIWTAFGQSPEVDEIKRLNVAWIFEKAKATFDDILKVVKNELARAA